MYIERKLYKKLLDGKASERRKPLIIRGARQVGRSTVDLIYQHLHFLIPIEVKFGPQGIVRSLHQFIERTNHHYAFRLLANTYHEEEVNTASGKRFKLYNLPYFLASKLPEYIEWIVGKRE